MSAEEVVSNLAHMLHARKWVEFVTRRYTCCGEFSQSRNAPKQEVVQAVKQLPLYKVLDLRLLTFLNYIQIQVHLHTNVDPGTLKPVELLQTKEM